MPRPTGKFYSARLKVEWANQHIKHLNTAISGFIESHRELLTIDRNPEDGSYRLNLTGAKIMPPEIALLIGDTAHNLRSALDHVTSQIVGHHDDRVHFPMEATREALVASDKFRRIEHADPLVAEVILHRVQPFSAENLPLIRLNRINNTDKHKLFVPAFTITGLRGVSTKDYTGGGLNGGNFTVSAGRIVCPLESDIPFEITDYGQPTGDVYFPETAPFQREPVVPAMAQMGELVLRAIGIVEDAYFAK